jgi:uncharacterized protein
MHYLLFYEFVPDYLQRRAQFRSEHLRWAWDSHSRGELLLGGAYADPADGAAILFRCESRSVPERFAESDPYVRAGLVTRWLVREWSTVVGDEPVTAVHPAAPGD